MSEASYRNVKVLIKEREHSPFWWLWPIIGALVVVGLISAFWLRPSFQDDTKAHTLNVLKEKGIDTTGLQVESNYRDVKITGRSATGVTPKAITTALAFKKKGAWDHRLNALEIKLDAPKAPVEVAVKTGPTNVKGVVSEKGIVLTGEVLTQAQKDTIHAAAVARFGEANVTNNITISKLAETTKGADGRATALAAMISGTPKGVTGIATLSDTKLTFEGSAGRASDKPAFEKVFENLSGVETSLSLQVPEVAKQIDTLDAEFAALSIEIQRKVVFPTASAVLRPSARNTLNKAVVLMKKYSLPVVSIEGHTDDRGDADKNQNLSERRAKSVINYLSKKGIAMKRLNAFGAGESQPLVSNDSAAGRQKNRRVVFTAKKNFN